MKVLTMCEGGNVRSVALGYILKAKYGVDAIACGWRFNSPETLKVLFEWADRIVLAQEIFLEHIPLEYRSKVLVLEMGPDRWGILVDLKNTAEFLVDQAMGTVRIIPNPYHTNGAVPQPKKRKR